MKIWLMNLVMLGTILFMNKAIAQAPNATPNLAPNLSTLDDTFKLGEEDSNNVSEVCQKPALSQLKKHRIAPGETIETIAAQYNLIPITIIGLNPILQTGQIPIGKEIFIPPYNGIAVRVPPGQTWQSVARFYNIRADLLFEINGCQTTPRSIFVPGVNWSPGNPTRPMVTGLSGYPLAARANIGLVYGWQLHPVLEKVIFHSGLDLLADVGTPVISIGEGVVAFAGKHPTYGNLVVVNHQAGKQSRYAHLEAINVKVGQTVKLKEVLGTVGVTGTRDIASPHLHFEVRYNSPLGWVAENPETYPAFAKTRN